MGVSIGKSGVKVLFLTFADDTMIFAKANVDSCKAIRSILDKYYLMSGLIIINRRLNVRRMSLPLRERLFIKSLV